MSGPERDSSESTWEVSPAPNVVPLTQVDRYTPPAEGSLDPRTLRLFPVILVPWALLMTAAAAIAVVGLVLLSNTAVDFVKGVALLAGALAGAAFFWYRVFFAPRLTLDAEGMGFTTYGLTRETTSLTWAEIRSVRLRSGWSRMGNNLSLEVATLPSGDDAPRPRRSLGGDTVLDLGMAGFGRVDRALRRYCRCDYSSSHWG